MSIYRSSGRGRNKKPSLFETMEPKDRLRFVLAEHKDPMKAVMDILYPDHGNIVGSDMRESIEKPRSDTEGLFRVIYAEAHKPGARPKIRSTIVKAMNGYDAKTNFEVDSYLDQSRKNATVIGTECVYVPRKLKNEFLKEFQIYNDHSHVTPLVEQAWRTLIFNLEIFEDEKPAPKLTNFINDE